jgi:hypothetical protein
MDPIFSPIVIATVAYSALTAVWTVWKARKDKKRAKEHKQQLAKMHADLQAVAATCTEVVQTIKPVDHEGLDAELHTMFDALKESPGKELFDQLMSLIGKKKTALLGGITFQNIEEFVLKSEQIGKQVAEMIAAAETLLEKEEDKTPAC